MYLGYVLLGMSTISLTVYLLSLSRLTVRPRRRGLVRTAWCRVIAACLYLVISMATLTSSPSRGVISISVFVIIQLMWQANSIADALLTRRDNGRWWLMASLVDYFQSLNIRALSQRVDALALRVERLGQYMSQLRDFVDAVNAETSRIGDDVKAVADKLDAAIASGDPSALADLGTAVTSLHAAGDTLHALATGTNTDPVLPPSDGTTSGDVPAPATPA